MNRVNAVPIFTILPESKFVSNRFVAFVDNFARRVMDISASLLGLFLLSPFFLFIAMLIKRDSPGPVFYHGPRAGRFGKRFGILKFRTMYERPESYAGPKVTASGDGRITPFGHWLRNTKVNELPQLWNVLVGEMSLVGPRPEDPDIAADWPEETRKEILSVRPGITSPASVLYRDEEQMLCGDTADTAMEDYWQKVLPSKLRLDLIYVRNHSVFTDLDVIFWTAIVLLPQLRKQSIPERLLYWGPLSQLFARYLNWFVVDWLVALLAVVLAGLFWRTLGPYDVGMVESVLLALGAAFCFSMFNYALGLNRISWARSSASGAIDLVVSASVMTMLLVFSNWFLFLHQIYPTRMLLTSGALATVGFIALRYRERLFTGLATRWLTVRGHSSHVGERVLIVGAGEMGHFASWMFKHSDFARAFSVVGMVDDDPRKVGMKIDNNRVMGTVEAIPELVEKLNVGIVVYAINRIYPEQRDRILSVCRQVSTRLVLFPDLMAQVKSSMMRPEMLTVQQWDNWDKGVRVLDNGKVAHTNEELNCWLDRLEQSLDSNNLALAHKQITQIRERISTN